VRLPIGQSLAWTGVAAIVLAPLLGAVVSDFFFYWFHRAQHRWFWRFHAVHHSIREMNAVNSYHHPTEAAFQMVLMVIPASLIVADVGPTVLVIGIFLQLQIVYLHSPTKLHFGFLRPLIADNRYHRIHHSLEPRHFDKNFAAFAPLWDRLFGTAFFPKADEWPDVGLAEIGEPTSIHEWLDLPFRFGKQPDGAPLGEPTT
jgi:sterol desaturase/sphingolipid hydroxylase (fatty acid hydroxylase superfamily)